MNSEAFNPSSLVDVLDEQIRTAQAMLGTLDRESRALHESNPEALNSAGADKARLVETLELLEHERRELAEAMSVKLSASEGDNANARWRELLGLIEKCREQNQRNGVMVKARREQVLEALKLLRGSELELYDSTGVKPASSGLRPLGSA